MSRFLCHERGRGGAPPLLILALLLAPDAVRAQRADPAPISLEVRSTVPETVLRVQVSAHDGAEFGLAVWNGAPGSVAQTGSRGSGTTPLIVNASKLGRIRLAVSANEPPIRVTIYGDAAKPPRVLGTGRVLDVVRDSLGVVTVTPGK
jgi:hypothetical protein